MLWFRSLVPADFPLLLDWLQRPHIKEWWDDGDDTLEKVALHFSEPWENELVERFMLLLGSGDQAEGQPIGYLQWYVRPDNTAGIDLFIGEAGLLNQGLGSQALRQFVALLIERHDPARIFIDPDPRNTRAIRSYEKAGFQYYATVTNEDGTPAYMMQIDRRALFAGND